MDRDVAETIEEDARGSGYARAGSMKLVDNARVGCQVGPIIAETGCGSYRHGCAIDYGKKGQPR